MQQTTYGAIPKKTKICSKNVVDRFLEENEKLFISLEDSNNCLYSDIRLVSDQALNYLNVHAGSDSKEQLKILLKNEFIECEKIYPYLGDYFIYKYFIKNYNKDTRVYSFLKETSLEFENSLKFKEIRSIFRWLLENASLEYSVSVQKNILNNIYVEKNNILNFDLDYDASFLGGQSFHKMSKYKFIIIDGYIESTGEIHHLLDQANRTKVPHVIFCFGMSDEVSHVIKHNNSKSKFEVMPVVIKFDENTINVLNDIAVLHNDNIVSSNAGQTISSAVRSELRVGKEIIFHNGGFKITPVATEKDLMMHRQFLNKRIAAADHEESKKLIVERLKRFSSKSVKIYIPESVYENNDFMREIDYILRFIKNVNKQFCIIDIDKRKYFMPSNLIEFVKGKAESLKKIYSQIDKLVLYDGN